MDKPPIEYIYTSPLIRGVDEITTVDIMFDGSCGPINPNGNIGIGFIIESGGELIASGWGYNLFKGFPTSNNQAEWKAVYEAIKYLDESGIVYDTLNIKGDSMLVINQLKGIWRVGSGTYADIAKKTLSKYSDIIKKSSISHVGRDLNKDCDYLSNYYIRYLMEEFNYDTGGPFKPPKK